MTHRGRIDVKELLKRDAYGDAPGCDTHFEKSRPCLTAAHGMSDQYVMLDSFVKLRESRTAQGEYRWNFMVQGVTGDEVVGVRDRIDTVVEMQMGSFAMPMLPDVPYFSAGADYVDSTSPYPPLPASPSFLIQTNNDNAGNGPPILVPNVTTPPYGQYPYTAILPSGNHALPWTHNPYSQTPFFGAMTVQVREAGLQSFSDRDGARHHFEYRITPGASIPGAHPNMALAKPMCGELWDTYTFTDPLRDVHGVTLVFRNPDTPIVFEPDVLYSVPAAFDGNILYFDYAGHGLNVGDRVHIRGFASDNKALDTYVNRPEGHLAGDEPSAPPPPGTAITTSKIYLDPSITRIPPINISRLSNVYIYVAKRRLRIPVRFRRVIDRLTNYKSV